MPMADEQELEELVQEYLPDLVEHLVGLDAALMKAVLVGDEREAAEWILEGANVSAVRWMMKWAQQGGHRGSFVHRAMCITLDRAQWDAKVALRREAKEQSKQARAQAKRKAAQAARCEAAQQSKAALMESGLSRAELQARAKAAGIRANQSSAEILNQLQQQQQQAQPQQA